MQTKRIGAVLLIFSIFLLIFFVITYQELSTESEEIGCFNSPDCKPIQASFSFVDLGFGLFGFIVALSFYLLFLSKGDKEFLNHLKERKSTLNHEEKFSILLLGLDEFEKRVLKEIVSQEGITQNTLCLRSDMSKAKLSQVLTNLEKKNLIKRQQQKKTLAVFSTIRF
ncbi:MAG: helix-turn-helix domain-containing protein [archaeon]|nr:helix-turn-helix domain-containing protein [archaeon]